MSKKEIKKIEVKAIRVNKDKGGIEVVPTDEYNAELHKFLKSKKFSWHRVNKYYYRSADEGIVDALIERLTPQEKAPTKSAVSAAIKSREALKAQWAEEKAAKQAKPASKGNGKKAQPAKPADVDALLAKIGISREDLLVALLSK